MKARSTWKLSRSVANRAIGRHRCFAKARRPQGSPVRQISRTTLPVSRWRSLFYHVPGEARPAISRYAPAPPGCFASIPSSRWRATLTGLSSRSAFRAYSARSTLDSVCPGAARCRVASDVFDAEDKPTMIAHSDNLATSTTVYTKQRRTHLRGRHVNGSNDWPGARDFQPKTVYHHASANTAVGRKEGANKLVKSYVVK
jgi:hypothetical protein